MNNLEKTEAWTDEILLSLVHGTHGEEQEKIIKILKERGYKLCGFHWTKDPNEKDPLNIEFTEKDKKLYEMFKKD